MWRVFLLAPLMAGCFGFSAEWAEVRVMNELATDHWVVLRAYDQGRSEQDTGPIALERNLTVGANNMTQDRFLLRPGRYEVSAVAWNNTTTPRGFGSTYVYASLHFEKPPPHIVVAIRATYVQVYTPRDGMFPTFSSGTTSAT